MKWPSYHHAYFIKPYFTFIFLCHSKNVSFDDSFYIFIDLLTWLTPIFHHFFRWFDFQFSQFVTKMLEFYKIFNIFKMMFVLYYLCLCFIRSDIGRVCITNVDILIWYPFFLLVSLFCFKKTYESIFQLKKKYPSVQNVHWWFTY